MLFRTKKNHLLNKIKLTGKMATFFISTVIFIGLLLFLPADISWSAKATISIMAYGVLLWAFESLPLGMTSIFMMVLLLLLQAVPIDIVLSGFGSPAVFLIVAGMMIAKCVNETPFNGSYYVYVSGKMGIVSKRHLYRAVFTDANTGFFHTGYGSTRFVDDPRCSVNS